MTHNINIFAATCPQIERLFQRQRWCIINHMTPTKSFNCKHFLKDMLNTCAYARAFECPYSDIDCNLIVAPMWMSLMLSIYVCVLFEWHQSEKCHAIGFNREENTNKKPKRVTSIIQVLIRHRHRMLQSLRKLSSTLAQLVNWKVGALVTAFLFIFHFRMIWINKPNK